MRCILIKDGKGPAENLYIGEEETPKPKKGEVQVKVSESSAGAESRAPSATGVKIVRVKGLDYHNKHCPQRLFS